LPSLWGRNGVLPAGVRQGELGDCWFLSAAAALAERPERLKKIFVNQEYPENGAFRINFFSMGRPVSVIVDDRLPMDPSDGNAAPVNTRVSKNGAWWMPILEKAYAKFNVFHANIDGGTPLQSIQDLTNMPAERFESNDQSTEELFGTLHEADQKDWIAIGACYKTYQGLTSGHAYTILGALKLTDDEGKEWNLLRMRNPWGSEGYNGPWSDKDHRRWTDSMRLKAGHTQADDGIFLLPVETFRVAFTYYYVGMYQDWKTSTWTNSKPGKTHRSTISSSVDQDAVLTLRWIARRRHPQVGCEGKEENATQSYNVFLTNTSTGERRQEAAYNDIGYVYHRFEGGIKAGHTWKLMVYDFNYGQAQEQDFTVTLHAAQEQINFNTE